MSSVNERARISSDRGLDEARVGRERELRKLEVAREQVVEAAMMDKAIAIYQKLLAANANDRRARRHSGITIAASETENRRAAARAG